MSIFRIFRIVILGVQMAGGVIPAMRSVLRIIDEQGIVGLTHSLSFLAARSNVSNSDEAEITRVKEFAGWLGPLVNEVEEIDPRVALIPLSERVGDPVIQISNSNVGAALGSVLLALGGQKFSTVILVPRIVGGGAEKVARNIAKALTDNDFQERVLFIETARFKGEIFSNLGSRHFALAPNVEQRHLDNFSEIRFYYALLQSLGVSRIININSEIAFQLFEKHVELLNTFAKTYVAFFCEDFDANGHDRSYATQYYPVMAGRVTGIISDNSRFVRGLEKKYYLKTAPSNFLPLYQPIDLPGTSWKSNGWNRPYSVAWAGRIVHQKGLEQLIATAKELVSTEFHIFGGPEEYSRELKKRAPKNLRFYGEYNSIEVLLECMPDVFLYTAQWDGIPNVLLEVGSLGIPIVTAACGAIPELIGENGERGTLVRDFNSGRAFSEALKVVQLNKADIELKAVAMTEYLKVNHSWNRFRDQVAQTL